MVKREIRKKQKIIIKNGGKLNDFLDKMDDIYYIFSRKMDKNTCRQHVCHRGGNNADWIS